jgi:16S rRNA (guanine527-N7)-methyltransferase
MAKGVRELLDRAASEVGLALQDPVSAEIAQFLDMFMEHRDLLGLMAPVSWRELVYQHVMDALLGTSVLNPMPGERVIDVGSGGGFPGIPLAVANPGVRVTLLEVSRKKAGFLRRACAAFCGRVEVECRRAEDAGRAGLRGAFDCCVSRAAGPMPAVLEWCLPLVRVGGRVGLWKGPDPYAEVKASARALEVLGGRLHTVHLYELPGGYGCRSVVMVQKEAVTPKMYPRRAGVPEKRPL